MKTIIWDLDGTLLDSFGIYTEVLGIVLPKLKLKVPSEEKFAQNYHGSLKDSINSALGGGISDKQLDAIIANFLTVQNSYYEVVDHHLFHDAVALARRAHKAGFVQILVTNRHHKDRLNASPRNVVEKSALKPFISKVICGDESEQHKPDPAVMGEEWLASHKGKEALVIGDQFVDAELARNLNARVIIVSRNGKSPLHMERLGAGWQDWVTTVSSLSDVQLS